MHQVERGAEPPVSEDQTSGEGQARHSTQKRLFRLSEAAIYLGRSTWSVRRLIWSGELPQVRAGGRVHVDVKDMDEFIEKHKVRDPLA